MSLVVADHPGQENTSAAVSSASDAWEETAKQEEEAEKEDDEVEQAAKSGLSGQIGLTDFDTHEEEATAQVIEWACVAECCEETTQQMDPESVVRDMPVVMPRDSCLVNWVNVEHSR